MWPDRSSYTSYTTLLYASYPTPIWYVPGCVAMHSLQTGCSFNVGLHNGTAQGACRQRPISANTPFEQTYSHYGSVVMVLLQYMSAGRP